MRRRAPSRFFPKPGELELPAGCDLILHPHRTVLTIEFAKLDAEIMRILQQAKTEQARGIKHPTLPGKAEPTR